MNNDAITIHAAQQADLALLRGIADQMKAAKSINYFENALERQTQGTLVVLLIQVGQDVAGYGLLNWQPKYAFYKKLEIPEIQDLNILPAYRQNGLATQLIYHCETLAKNKGCEYMGISYGLDSSYGPAQRLYTKLGYSPDGNGVTYDRAFLTAGDIRPIDDDLCLMLIKELG